MNSCLQLLYVYIYHEIGYIEKEYEDWGRLLMWIGACVAWQLLLQSLGSQPPHRHNNFKADGDQWLFHMVCVGHPRMCEALPREWNANGCSRAYPILGLSERGKLTNGTCWRMAHFDCLRADAVAAKEGKRIYKLPLTWHKSYDYLRGVDLHTLARNSTAF